MLIFPVSQENGGTDKERIKIQDIRKLVAETTEKIGSIPDLFLIHNRKSKLLATSIARD